MTNLTVEQTLEKYPYLKNIIEYTLVTSQEDYERLNNGEKIKVWAEEVSVEFLRRILYDDLYFDYVSRYFTDEITYFNVCFLLGGDTCGSIHYRKSTIIRGIEQLIAAGKITLQAEAQQRYASLRDCISFEKFTEKHQGNNYNITIEGIKYSIPIKQLVVLMQLPNEEFDDLCFNNEINSINGIPKEHFIYAAAKFFKETKALTEFYLPDNIVSRYADIGSCKKIDLEAINKLLKTKETKHKQVQLDQELEQAIISGMPENSSDLEKAIYLYIKMCKLLTYDDEYYAVNQKGEAAAKHQNLDYISTITLANNKVVCFEFNMIYSKLLNALGINFGLKYKGIRLMDDDYGVGHDNLMFRTGKYLVGVDSVTSILEGDLVQAKLNQPLVGITCINANAKTQREFQAALTKMYQLIAQQEKTQDTPSPTEHIQTLDELLEEYSHLTQNMKDIDLSERLAILIDKVNSTGTIGIDALSYVLQLRRILFTEEQRKNNIKVIIIRNNEPFDDNKIAMASAIFALNKQSFEDNPEQNIYYYFNPKHELIPITKEDLQTKFSDGIFAYVKEDDPKIPGIIGNGEIKR